MRRWPLVWLAGMIRTQPFSGVESVGATQAVTCSNGASRNIHTAIYDALRPVKDL